MLLVTSSRNINHWIVPGGGVDPGEEPAVTAVREVLEEAGVVGNLGRSLGVFEVNIFFVAMCWICFLFNWRRYLRFMVVNQTFEPDFNLKANTIPCIS